MWGFILTFILISTILIFFKKISNTTEDNYDYHLHKHPLAEDNYEDDNSSIDSGSYSLPYYQKKISKKYLEPKKEIKNVHNYFARKKILFTGDLDNFPDREDAAKILWELGADVDTQLSERINIVIKGNNPGEAKLEQINNLKRKGINIEFIDENKFINLISKELDKDDADESSMEFANQKFTINGEFEYFYKPNIRLIINDRGGEVLSTLQQKTTIFKVGYYYNHELITKAKQWNKEGKANITFSNEEDFLKLAFPDQTFHFEKPIGKLPFKNQKVLITGKFYNISRDELKDDIVLLGGTNTSALSKKTNLVIMGFNPGPSKKEKIKELINQGYDINIINEDDFFKIKKNAVKSHFKIKC